MSQSLIDKHHPENPKHVKINIDGQENLTLYVQNDSTSRTMIFHEKATNEPILYILLQFVFSLLNTLF